MSIFDRKKDKSEGKQKNVEAAIGEEQIRKAEEIRKQYQQGKTKLEDRIISCEKWYRLRNWELFEKQSDSNGQKNFDVKPKSAWLFNAIANKHADAMDNIPSANMLPREENDKREAEVLSSIIPVQLDQNNFEKTYSEGWYDKLINGTAVYSVMWDESKLNGLGDISIGHVDILNLFWEPGIQDIQQSRNLFFTQLVDNDILEEMYEQCRGRLKGNTEEPSHYEYDDTVRTENKSLVVDWYYKKLVGGKTVLHYCKYVNNDIVLYASENETERPKEQAVDESGVPVFDYMNRPIMVEAGPSIAERGFYDHGMYPFVFDPLFRIKGTPCGFGYVDVGKSPQELIDRMDGLLIENMAANAKPRYFIKSDGSVKEEEYADMNNVFIHVDGNLGQDSIIPVKTTSLNGIYVTMLMNKIEELKETTGNRDVSNGGTSGATAASAIAAMQEAGSKLSRDANKQTYRAFREIIVLVIELIRQFYDTERSFRITGKNGQEDFITYSNAGIVPQPQGDNGTTDEMGVDVGYRVPLFDIEVSAQKQSPYSKMAQNELAMQFYSAGFFNPENTDPSLACLEMMDFDRKSFVMSRIQQNGTMLDIIKQMQQQMIRMQEQMDAMMGVPPQENVPLADKAAGASPRPTGKVPSLPSEAGESSITQNARMQAAERTAPR